MQKLRKLMMKLNERKLDYRECYINIIKFIKEENIYLNMVSTSKRRAIVNRIDTILTGGSKPVRKKKPKKKALAKERKFKIAEIRKASKESPKDAKAYLNLALEDIHKEEEKLRQKREDVNKLVASTEMSMTRTRSEEDKLRDELSKLISKESRINARKTRLKTELAKIDERIIKVKKIDDEIKEASMA